MPASAIRKLHNYAVEAKNRGVKVYHINIGQPDIETPLRMREAVKNCEDKIISYTPSQGTQSYLQKLEKYYKEHSIDVNAEDILVTVGGSEAILFSLMAIGDYGDDVLIPEPFYTNYNGFCHMAGLNVIPVPTYLEDGFRLPDISVFEKLLTPKTKAVMFSSPGNPTGTVYTYDQLKNISLFCKKHNLFMIADEAYCEITQRDKVLSMLDIKFDFDIKDNVIVVDSISKRYNACGARIGRIITKNKSIIANTLKFAQARLCAPYYEQIMGETALDLGDSYLIELASEYQKRIDASCSELAKIPDIKYHHSEGAFYIIVKLPVDDVEDFSVFLLEKFYSVNPKTGEKETIMVAPATGFYRTPGRGKDEIRIACVLDSETMKRTMQILKESIEQYKK
jgi:aspartate aminotransferase